MTLRSCLLTLRGCLLTLRGSQTWLIYLAFFTFSTFSFVYGGSIALTSLEDGARSSWVTSLNVVGEGVDELT